MFRFCRHSLGRVSYSKKRKRRKGVLPGCVRGVMAKVRDGSLEVTELEL